MSTGGSRALARDAVANACATATTADELLEALDTAVQSVLPHDGGIWFGLDPVTMLATAPSRVRGMDESLCSMFWHLEFHEQDAALFTDLAIGDGAAALHLTLDGRPNRSIRYRECLRPQGYDDELRAVFRSNGTPWGAAALYREGRTFDEDDVALLMSLSDIVAGALRAHVRQASPWLELSSPGMLFVDDRGCIASANAEALTWLRTLWPMSVVDSHVGSSALTLGQLRDRSISVPTPLYALVAKARAIAEGRERGPARLRLRDEAGRWALLHASVMSGPGDPGASVAVVIESARGSEIAPMLIDAYSLTPREREVLGAIARGASTADIAAQLFLSVHTVRDYVKTVFEKLEVSSRGELVSRLFTEHYADPLHATITHA